VHSTKTQAEHKQLRSTAWAVIDCVEICRPRFVVVENVPEFSRWALFDLWCATLRRLDYHVTTQVLTASCWGVPQRRRRLFVVARLDRPITLGDADVPEATAASIFDESVEPAAWIPIEHIRERGSKRGAPTSRARAALATERLGGPLGWGVHVSHRGVWGRPMTEPVTTLTTRAGQHWWVRDGMYRQWTILERKRAMGFPDDYDLCGATKGNAAKLLGNAVPPPLAAAVIRATLDG